MTTYRDVTAMDKGGCRWRCMRVKSGFRCGVCQRGQFGPEPKIGAVCAVCGATVDHTETEASINFGFPLRFR